MSTEQFPARSQRNEDEALAVFAGWDLLRVTVERRNEMAVLHVRGEVELATVGRLSAVLDHELVSGAIDILLDLHDVTFIDCSGVSVLVDTTHRAAERGVRLRIVPGPALHRLSEILGLTGELDLGDGSR
jgi:anti-anti-sigma factor